MLSRVEFIMGTVLLDQGSLLLNSNLFNCRFCRSKAVDVHPVDAALNLGFVMICHCNTSNLPFVVCLTCRVVSSHSRNQSRRNLYKHWHKKHFSSPGHCHNLMAASIVEDTLFDIDDTSVEGSLISRDNNTPTSLVPVTPLSVVSHLNLEGCEFFNERMRMFYQLEHSQTGLGFSNILRRAFDVDVDASDFTTEEVSFHLTICRLCVDSTRSQLKKIGYLLKEVIKYYAGKHKLVLSSEDTFQRIVQSYHILSIQRAAQPLSEDQSAVLFESIQQVLSPSVEFSLTDFSATIVDGYAPSTRGVFRATYPPGNSKDLFRLYLDSEKSVYRNLPCPDVHLTPDKRHAYLHLGQVVASFTAGGASKLEVPTVEEFASKGSTDFDSYYLSPIALTVYSEVSKIALLRGLEGKIFSIHIKDWADDAQKNSSRTNLLSYNIRTITFLRHGRNGDIRYFTFVLSVGLKGSDHEEVERILSKDLSVLGTIPHLFYSGHHHGTFWGTVHLVAGVRDRPARGETFFLGIHSHSFGKRFRYAMYHDENTKIISCDSCHARRVRHTRQQSLLLYSGTTLTECDICADLEYTPKETTQIDLAYLTGKSKAKDFAYPKILVEGSPTPPQARLVGPNVKVLSPVKLDYPFLYAVCSCGFYNFHSRAHKLFMRRNKSEREKRTLGPAIGWSGKELKSYLRTSSLNEAILKRTKSFSQKYIESSPADVMTAFIAEVLPSAWSRSGYELSHQHDAVFHLAFHGILPDIWEMILKSVARFEIKRKWEDIVNVSLSLLHGLQLDDLAVLPFGDKFSMAGWVGSNKMGFSWLLPYFVSHLEHVLDLAKPNMGEDLKLEATSVFLKIKRVVVSFQCVISRLLQRTLYPALPMEVHHYVKILLCEVTSLQKTYIPENKRK